MILFAFTLPKVNGENSENIFYSCFLAFCQIKQLFLTEVQRNVIKSQIVEKEKIERLKMTIVQAY